MDEATWPGQWPDAALEHHFGPEVVARGRGYQERGHVGRIDTGGTPDHPVMTATVRGSEYRGYRTVVVLGADGTVRATCSCPMRTDCKHAVAVLLTARAQATRRRVPAWEEAMQALVHDVRGPSTSTPLALEFTGNVAGLRMRPLRMGRSGSWVRTGVTWETLSADYRQEYDPGQRLALLDVRRSSHRDVYLGGHHGRAGDLDLDDTRHDVWAALRAVHEAGVAFISASGTPPVRLADEAAAVVAALERTPTGLRLEARIRVPGLARGTPVQVVGTPSHGVLAEVDGVLVMAGFGRPLTGTEQSLLHRTQPTEIPDSDLAQFAIGYLPTLRRELDIRVPDDLDLPTAAAPVLTLDVHWHPDHRATLQWGVLYRVGDTEVRVSPAPSPDDPPLRDPDAERALFAALPSGRWPTTEVDGRARPAATASLTGRDLIDFVADSLPALQQLDEVEVGVHGEMPEYREADEAPQVRVAVREDDGRTDWFNLDVDVTIDGETVPFAELFRALATGEDHLVLGSGTWFDLGRPELEQLRQLIAEAQELSESEPDQLRLRVEHAGLWEELVHLGIVAEQAARWRAATRALLAPEEMPDAPAPAGLRATLRPYQHTGLTWLRYLWTSRLGGVLADDMGLGKTLQVLALVASMHESAALEHPVLVVAPTSVLGTWASEAARFTPDLSVKVVTRTARKRDESLAEIAAGAQVVVTSYTLLRLDDAEYADQPWAAVVLDEAQFVKNRASKAYQTVRRLRAGVRFAITGTPLENNLMDLWSLLSITCPGLFPDPEKFAEFYRRPIESGSDAEALPRLRRRIRPVMLRRTKESVAAELPPKQEQVLPVALSPTHRRLYDRQLQAERRKVLGLVGDMNRNRIAILRSLTMLRQLALSPALVDPTQKPDSAKIDTLVELLTEVSAEGHRALVFSQFTSFLALVRQRFDAEGLTYQYLDGRTRNRAERVQTFREGDDPAFLISLKAGGFGLTLTEADYVFVLDPWWNPAAEMQAIDRTHRIGQDKQVMVYRMVSADTIEQKVVALQQRKRDLFAQVVGGGDGDMAAPLRAEDVRALLEL